MPQDIVVRMIADAKEDTILIFFNRYFLIF
jgi:hypothetical protein